MFATILLPRHGFHVRGERFGSFPLKTGSDMSVHLHGERSGGVTEAMQFAMNAPIKGIGIVLTGPANLTELDEVYSAATTLVPKGIWQEFHAEFGVQI